MSSIWTTLGLAPGADRAAIRRAYAQRLKQTNPEDDAAGFQALRDAYEQALRLADRAQYDQARDAHPIFQEAAFEDAWVETRAPQPAFEAAASTPATSEADEPPLATDHPAPPPTAVPATHERDDLGRARLRLEVLLHAEAPHHGDLQAALEALFAAERRALLSASHETEHWLADLLARTQPNSDPLLPEVLKHYRWERPELRADIPYAAHWLIERRGATLWRSWVERKSDERYKAWRLLTGRARDSAFRRLLRSQEQVDRVTQVLGRVHDDYPSLEEDLDPDAVATWERHIAWRATPKGKLSRFGVLVARWLVIVACISLLKFGAGLAFGDAPADLRRRATLEGANSATWADLCRRGAQRSTSELEQAVRDCDTALRSDAEPLGVSESRGVANLRLGHHAEARADFDRALEANRDSVRARYGRGLALWLGGDPSGAKDMAAAMAVSPPVADEFIRYGLRPPASERSKDDAEQAPRMAPPPGYAGPRWVEGGDAISDAFPQTALRAEVSGTVLLNCTITVAGAATNCEVLEESPAGFGFGKAALQASSRFRFKPATYQGRPIEAAQVKIPIRFQVQ